MRAFLWEQHTRNSISVQFELRRDLLTLRSVSSNSLTTFIDLNDFQCIDFLLPSLLISVHFLSSLGEEIIPILFCLFSASAFPSFVAVTSLNDFFTLATKVSGVKIK